jgi:hypothetical protein
VAEVRARLTPGTPVEIWFQDEMRVGQKNKLTDGWARTGSRPRTIHDQRTQSTYLFGAVCGTGCPVSAPWRDVPVVAGQGQATRKVLKGLAGVRRDELDSPTITNATRKIIRQLQISGATKRTSYDSLTRKNRLPNAHRVKEAFGR